MFLEIIRAEYVGDYKLHLWFNNQEEKVVDLEDSLRGPVFLPLKEKSFFADFQIKFNTVEWKNGADFAPEYLYELPDAETSKVAESDGSEEYSTQGDGCNV